MRCLQLALSAFVCFVSWVNLVWAITFPIFNTSPYFNEHHNPAKTTNSAQINDSSSWWLNATSTSIKTLGSISNRFRNILAHSRTLQDYRSAGACDSDRADANNHNQFWYVSNNDTHVRQEPASGPHERLAPKSFNLVKRAGGDYRTGLGHDTKGNSRCQMISFCYTPYYPSVEDVKRNEILPAQQQGEMRPFFNIAKYWTIADRYPTESTRCPRWQLTVSTQDARYPDGDMPGFAVGGRAKYFVSTDHLYEIKLLDTFFLYLIDKKGLSCDDIQQVFDQQGIEGTRLTDLYSNLPKYSNPEFVGMDDRVNQAKALIWRTSGFNNNNSPIRFQKGPGKSAVDSNKDQLAIFAIALQLLNDYRVRMIFEITNRRIYQAFAAIGQQWANHYQTWMTDKIMNQNQVLQSAANRVSASIPTAALHPRAPEFPDEIPRWSSFMSSLLATYPIASMTLPAVHNFNLVEPTGLEANVSTPMVTSKSFPPLETAKIVSGDKERLGDSTQPLEGPSITGAATDG